MYYELYIDVFFFTNFMMDSLLLLAVRAMLKIRVRTGRAFLGGALAAFLACVMIALPFPELLKYILFYVGIPALSIRIGLGICQAKDFVKAFALLYFAAFLWGGIQTALRPYIHAAGVFFAVSVASYYLFSFFWQLATSVQKQQKKICEVRLFTGEGEYVLKALLDTGNALQDPISGEPVSVIGKDTAGRILGGDAEQKMAERGLRYIPYRTVGGEGVLPIVRMEKMCVKLSKDEWVVRPIIGISGQKIEERQEYQIILNPDIISKRP